MELIHTTIPFPAETPNALLLLLFLVPANFNLVPIFAYHTSFSSSLNTLMEREFVLAAQQHAK
jgi:hypothetical protein